ncbi:hypothetical protein [Kitasatospora sp. NPDC088134]|uniref:hypothetical protein n=1 Tax=Kitasatospora sp. NPDC088134 TaxID=3364071 RepID=UPI0037F9D35E
MTTDRRPPGQPLFSSSAVDEPVPADVHSTGPVERSPFLEPETGQVAGAVSFSGRRPLGRGYLAAKA